MVPTRRFWLLVALGIPVAAVASELGQPLLAVAYNALLVLAAWVTGRLAPSDRYLRLRRRFDPVLSVRTPNVVNLAIENDGPEPMAFRLRDEPPPRYEASQREFSVRLGSGETKELAYTLTPSERGSERFRGTWVRIACPLGLVERQAVLPTAEPFRVYPNVLALRAFDLLKQQGRLRELGIRRNRNRGLGTEFESLRNYALGDDFRKIDWKASARRGDLVVRQYEQERNQAIVIVLDVGRHMLAEAEGVPKLDHVLDAILVLTQAAALAGDHVGLLVYADTVRRYIPPRKGRAQLGLVIEACHDLVAEAVESDHAGAMAYLAGRHKRRSLLLGFTDYDDPDRARDLVTAYAPMARRHLTFLCRVMDPRLENLERTPLDEVSGLYQRAAASMLMEDRRAALGVLSAASVHTLDAEPAELAARLVSHYFHVKERALL